MTIAFFDRLQQETEQERQALFSLPIIQRALQGQINQAQYIAFLTQALAEYIEEEIGHEEWILSDIKACGGQPEEVRNTPPDLTTESMVAYAYHQIDRLNPVGFFGMVYVLEGTSTALATNAASVIKHSLGLPSNAFTYLTSHGSLDLEHMKFFESIMNQLTEEADKASVIYCAKRFYALYEAIFKSLPNFNC